MLGERRITKSVKVGLTVLDENTFEPMAPVHVVIPVRFLHVLPFLDDREKVAQMLGEELLKVFEEHEKAAQEFALSHS